MKFTSPGQFMEELKYLLHNAIIYFGGWSSFFHVIYSSTYKFCQVLIAHVLNQFLSKRGVLLRLVACLL